MATPAEIARQTKTDEAARTLGHIASLEKCDGWRLYMEPKVVASYDASQERILAAHLKGEAPAAKDIATYQAFHELVTGFRRDKRAAVAAVTHS